MAKITQLLPNDMDLAETLAGRVNQIRNFRNLTVRDLAKASRMTVARIEDIESGLETWLSAPDRQVLAKALRVEPIMLLEVEYRPPEASEPEELSTVSRAMMEELADAVLHGVREIPCPRCQTPMNCSAQEAIDLENNHIYLPMAYCPKCPFVLK